MNNLKVGDKVFNLETQQYHIVESIEEIDSNIYVFTEDIKCFPSQKLKKVPFFEFSEIALKFLDKKHLTGEEFVKFDNLLKKQGIELFSWNPPNINELVKEVLSKRK
jgi:hypothetical protein